MSDLAFFLAGSAVGMLMGVRIGMGVPLDRTRDEMVKDAKRQARKELHQWTDENRPPGE